MEFEGLVVLALDLEFGLEFFHQQLEARDFGLEFLDVACGGRRTYRRSKGLRVARDGRGWNMRRVW